MYPMKLGLHVHYGFASAPHSPPYHEFAKPLGAPGVLPEKG